MKCTCLTIISFDLVLKPCEVCRGLSQSLFLQMKNRGTRGGASVQSQPLSQALESRFPAGTTPSGSQFSTTECFHVPSVPLGFPKENGNSSLYQTNLLLTSGLCGNQKTKILKSQSGPCQLTDRCVQGCFTAGSTKMQGLCWGRDAL